MSRELEHYSDRGSLHRQSGDTTGQCTPAPGKTARTDKLQPRQAKAQNGAAQRQAEQENASDVEDWSRVVFRPDLYTTPEIVTPVQRKNAGAWREPAPGYCMGAGGMVEDWSRVAFRPALYTTPELVAPVQRQGDEGLLSALNETQAIQARDGGRQQGEMPAAPAPTGGGARMPEDVQGKMEAAFGADFSSVRIHEGAQTPAIGALAYTQGSDIHFAPGQYQPHSQSGQELLGHELTHVVQQAQGRVQATTQAKGVAVNDDAALEQEADEMGARAARGEAVARTPPPKCPACESKSNPGSLQVEPCPSCKEGDTYQTTAENTGTTEDQRLNGHKLAHTVQQGGRIHVQASTIQFKLDPPGDCSPSKHFELQKDVKKYCDRERKCRSSDSCADLIRKMNNNSQCIAARQRINATCYRGGDDGHNIAVMYAVNSLMNCQAIYKNKCTQDEREPERRPVPVPVPVPAPRPVPDPNPSDVPWWLVGLGVTAAAALVLADGPLPVGDAAAASILVGIGVMN